MSELETKATYKIKRGMFHVTNKKGVGELKTIGDTIELTDEQAERNKRNVERVGPSSEPESEHKPVELEPDISKPVLVDHPVWDVADDRVDSKAGDETQTNPWSYILEKKVDLVLGIIRTAAVSDLPSLRLAEMSNPAGPRARVIAAVDKRMQASSVPESEG